MVILCASLRELSRVGRAETPGERGGIGLGIPQLSYIFFSSTAYGWDPFLLLKLLHVLAALPWGLSPLCPWALLPSLGEGISPADASLIWSLCFCPNRLSVNDPFLTQLSEEITFLGSSWAWGGLERKVNGSRARWTLLRPLHWQYRDALPPSPVPAV